ncbi:AAA family ATPase [Actinoplanes sp. NPDC051513]|uniref:helix-turn-helix transcriptional regulator n=1 Tax=Actinoplanes sp. NPDC051513 TaxID=3363908 RepID=UPI00378DB7A6
MGLLGRARECATLDRLADQVAGGDSRVLVLRGDAGAGKSALLGHLTNRLKTWQVASAVGVESEMELAYSALQQLCSPLLGHLDRLPGPQRDALATVFGLAAGPVPDRLMVGLATLTLLAEAAEEKPLACVVDDAQWLDRQSAQVLAFVARRLLAERVALVCAARTGSGDDFLTGMPELTIGGLDEGEARRLLLGGVHGPLDAAVADQIVTESHGNPLALLELPRTWSAADLAGGFGLPAGHQVAGRIEQSFVRRLARLPADTRLLVLAAAAEPLGDPVLLHRAAETLGVEMAAAIPAVDDGLLQVHGRVEFAHPLVRSAAYRTAPTADRHRVHHALAAATDAAADPDRRAWHRAHATAGLDEDVAAELELSAGRAQSRGGLAAAAAFLTRATELTPAPEVRLRRAMDAAFANVRAGAYEGARAMLAVARGGPLDERQRAMIDLVRAQLAFASSKGKEATPLLLAAARRLQPVDLGAAREAYLDALLASMFGGRLNDGALTAEVSRAARAAPRPPAAEPTAGDLLLEAFAALADDYATAVPLCREALAALRDDRTGAAPRGNKATPRLRWLWQGVVLALELWDDQDWCDLADRNLRFARATGALSDLPMALGSQIHVYAFRGELRAATALIAEARSALEATGKPVEPNGSLLIAAWRGAGDAIELIEDGLQDAHARGEGIAVGVAHYAHAVLCNGLGQYDEGLEAAARATDDPRDLAAQNWGLPELVEAAVRQGRPDVAADALDRLTARAKASGSDWALGVEARSRALLSEGGDAEDLFREAIERLGRTRLRAEHARAHLLYGEWLRRASRRVDARAELTRALEMLQAMGADGFAERARRELAATGATVRKRNAESANDLTAQEAQIARLAREGLSNSEIGAQLFISPRTVEWHLRKIFGKLGISSRRQLRGAALK